MLYVLKLSDFIVGNFWEISSARSFSRRGCSLQSPLPAAPLTFPSLGRFQLSQPEKDLRAVAPPLLPDPRRSEAVGKLYLCLSLTKVFPVWGSGGTSCCSSSTGLQEEREQWSKAPDTLPRSGYPSLVDIHEAFPSCPMPSRSPCLRKAYGAAAALLLSDQEESRCGKMLPKLPLTLKQGKLLLDFSQSQRDQVYRHSFQ